MLRIRTFGGCSVERDGARLDALTAQRKGLAILALLAASGEKGMSRDTLLSFLWPESDEERARTSLKQLVHSLRNQLQAPDLIIGTADLRLNPAVVTDDVTEFRTAMARQDYAAAMAVYEGPFLDGFYLRNADAFERWAASERSTHAQSAARAMERLAERAMEQGDARTAVEWWRRLSSAEPTSARNAIGLMRALDASGDRAAAINHARVYQTLVSEELGGVDSSVVAFVERLKRGPQTSLAPREARTPAPAVLGSTEASQPPRSSPQWASGAPVPRFRRAHAMVAILIAMVSVGAYTVWRQTRSADGDRATNAPRTMGRSSLAVLPFANTSGDRDDEAFSDGLTDELIGSLGRVPGLKVAGRTSVFALKGQRLSLRATADTLGVSTILEGSVRRSGQRLRVTAQLVDARANEILWTNTYDRELRDILAVQEEIGRAIVDALRLRFAQGTGTSLVRRPTSDPQAYELYLKGRYIWNTQLGRQGLSQAEQLFQQAIARDSGFARAYAGLSDTYARRGAFGYGRPHDEFPRAMAAARRALAIDSTLAEAHAAVGHILFVYDWDLQRSEEAYRRAIALDPAYTFARISFAVMLQGQGRFDEALAQLDTAQSIDPLSAAVPNVRGRTYVSARQPDQAIRHLREALDLNPALDLAYQQLGHAYLQKKMEEDAVSAFRQAAALSGARDSAELAYAYGVTGRRAEATAVIRKVLQTAGQRYVSPYYIAMAYAGLGDADSTFLWLDRSYEERALFAAGLQVEPAFERVHDHPRWNELTRRIKSVRR